ncbi:DUF2891 domain-containing protein [Natrialbaceae archaeon A-gly3]
MSLLDTVDPDLVLSGRTDWVDDETADALAEYPLECVDTEFPHFVMSVDSAEQAIEPAEDHPVFYGCFDWHSAVHSHWSLVRGLRLFDDHPREAEIVECIDRRLTPENAEREVNYFEENPTFEKPYGWSWLLRLAAELHLWDDERSGRWRAVLKPLEERIVTLVETEFLSQERPFRVGTHENSAFALAGVLDYARVTSRSALEAAVVETSLDFFEDDRDAPVEYEPFGWDFISPSLTEADLMARVLDGEEFSAWLEGLLPALTTSPYDSILEPIEVDPDPNEEVALHWVGLNLARAWTMVGIADALEGHACEDVLETSARRHVEYGLEMAFTDDYAGAHWLTSFVLYLLSRNEGAIAPS